MGRVPVPTYLEVDRAVAAASDAFDTGPWPRLWVDERAAYLRAAMEVFDTKYLDTAAQLQTDEMGAPESFTRSTTAAVPGLLEQVIQDAAEVRFGETRQDLSGRVCVTREPRGVATGIIPWSAPVVAAAAKLFPSLLTDATRCVTREATPRQYTVAAVVVGA